MSTLCAYGIKLVFDFFYDDKSLVLLMQEVGRETETDTMRLTYGLLAYERARLQRY
jgi:hypothetical protein